MVATRPQVVSQPHACRAEFLVAELVDFGKDSEGRLWRLAWLVLGCVPDQLRGERLPASLAARGVWLERVNEPGVSVGLRERR